MGDSTANSALVDPTPTPLQLSDDEKCVLDLYDRLQLLQLENALLKAHEEYDDGNARFDRPGRSLHEAQVALLESRATYVAQMEGASSVMMVSPVTQAVHGGVGASPIERDLLPVLEKRDVAATELALQSTELRRVLDDLTETEARSLRVSRENVDLASQILELAGKVNRNKREPTTDPEQAKKITRLEASVKASRQRWILMKGTASAIVVGAGVDWAREPELRDIVLDDGDEGV